MDPSLQPLLNRLGNLSGPFQELRVGVHEAIKIADISPEMALTRSRKVLEYLVRDVYERRINEPPGTRPLENLLQRLVKDGFFPDRLDAYANTIRKLGNVGTHTFGEKLAVADVYQSLAQLMPILEWYFETERPEALTGQPQALPVSRPLPSATMAAQPKQPPVAAVSASSHIAIVPKGLRSFDAHDAEFFLDLLPGPRHKDGLPQSIRFWKQRIEAGDEATFTVGVLYGPSGCGKSSLVKAGLLPRLAGRVLTVYVEATANETEARLLKALRKQCPTLPTDLGIIDTLAALRCGQGIPGGKKILIVVDQFEQWLHARRGEQDSELAGALRQCDGEHVQCLLLVRDDFWLALCRFMGDLHIELVQGQNIALVDLFDPPHARNVLAAFGRAFGRLDGQLSKEQRAFLDQTVAGLSQDGRVISVRLALFAEMVRGRPWTPVTLKAVGGTTGVGVSFLEETFCSTSADRKNRSHQDAARRVLKALLPEQGTNIKGHMRSYVELLEASGYGPRPQDFEELLHILDGELRLITPTDPDEAVAGNKTTAVQGLKYYQLAHDYLVHSLRDWLTSKQRETRRGRAELRLASRAALWTQKPENRHLPSLWEYLNIRLLTSGKTWSPDQRKMMQRAGRVQDLHAALAALLLVALVIGGTEVFGRIEARSLVSQLDAADVVDVPELGDKLPNYRRWADPLLRQENAEAAAGSRRRLFTSLALLPVDESQVNYLRDQLLVVSKYRFPVVRDALLPHTAAIIEQLWTVAFDSKRETQQAFQAACALATYASDDNRWHQLGWPVAAHLVTLSTSDLVEWREALRPARKQLVEALTAIYGDADQEQRHRSFATETLADYSADQPEVLVDLLADAEQFQFPTIFAKLVKYRIQAISSLLEPELAKRADDKTSADDKERLAKRQANVAVALFKLGRTEKLWPLLVRSPDSTDPRLRSYLIDRLGMLGGDVSVIAQRLDDETDVSARRALILSLGASDEKQWGAGQRTLLMPRLQRIYRTADDPGLHAAAEWLLRQWNQDAWLKQVDEEQAKDRAQREKRLQDIKRELAKQKDKAAPVWYVDGQGQTMIVIPGPATFLMGSPPTEKFHQEDETQHKRRIGRTFAIAAKPITVAEYQHFSPNYSFERRYAPKPECPVIGTSWFQAAAYCNWLSKQEGIDSKQWCYEPNDKGEYDAGMKAKDKYLQLSGYRLPTEAEWEYACRAGALTSRYYGENRELLPRYAWYADNAHEQSEPVGSLKPSDLGLFDMHGNVCCWCEDKYQLYPTASDGGVIEDKEDDLVVESTVNRVMRGGSFYYAVPWERSAYRIYLLPTDQGSDNGFRVARTISVE